MGVPGRTEWADGLIAAVDQELLLGAEENEDLVAARQLLDDPLAEGRVDDPIGDEEGLADRIAPHGPRRVALDDRLRRLGLLDGLGLRLELARAALPRLRERDGTVEHRALVVVVPAGVAGGRERDEEDLAADRLGDLARDALELSDPGRTLLGLALATELPVARRGRDQDGRCLVAGRLARRLRDLGPQRLAIGVDR